MAKENLINAWYQEKNDRFDQEKLKTLKELIDNDQKILAVFNLFPQFDQEFSFLYFVNPDIGGSLGSGLRVVSLRNVIDPNLNIIIPSCNFAGIFIPKTDDLKESLNEAKRIKQTLIRKRTKFYPNIPEESFRIAIATDKQVEYWKKLGFFDEIKPNLENAPSLLSIINALYNPKTGFGLDNLGVRFRTKGITVPQIDVSFYTLDENKIAQPCALTLWGWDKTLENLVPYENVTALVSVPRELPLSQRKAIQRETQKLLVYWLKNPEANVLTVDKSLLNFWQEKGALVSEETKRLLNLIPLRKRVDYGGIAEKPKSAKLVLFEPKTMVGGPQLLVDVSLENISSSVILDWGLPYINEALMSLGNRPSFIKGLNPFLEEGMLPEIRRLYRLDLLTQSLTPQMINTVLTGNYSFILGEIYHRKGWQYLADLINEKFPGYFTLQQLNDLKTHLEKIEDEYYSDKRIFEEVLISHGHTDHYGGLVFVRDEITAGMSPETYAFLNARFHQPGTWLDEHIIRKKRDNEKKPYSLAKRPIHLYFPNASERIAPHISVTAFPLNHSIIGALGFVIGITDKKGNPLTHVAYLTDFREGPLTTTTIEAIKSVAPEVLIIEGTNIAEEKTSSIVTEEMVKLNIEKFLKQADHTGGFFIIQIPPNHLERLTNIVEIAGQRKVAIPLPIAQILHEFYILNENLPPEQRINLPKIGTDLVVYYPQKITYDPWERQLIDQYQATDIFSLTSDPGNYIIIVSHYILLENLFAGQLVKSKNSQGYIINATYWPYSDQTKATLMSNYRFAKANNLAFLSDFDLSRNTIQRPREKIIGVHASGHASDEYLLSVIDQIAQDGSLKTVLPIHTQFRGKYAKRIIEKLRKRGGGIYPELDNIKIIGKVKKRVAEIPIF